MSVMLVFVLTMLGGVAGAGNWPQFLGPNGDATSSETGLADHWPEEGPPVLWTVELGPRFGGPVVYEGRVYLLDREVGKRDILRCWNLDNGEELWRYDYPSRGAVPTSGSRSHPAVDSERVYTIGVHGKLHAIDKRTHKPAWSHDLLKEYGGKLPRWGVSHAPWLHGDLVITAPTGKEAGVVAFDRESGEEVWTSPPLQGKMSYATPVVATVRGVEQVLVITTKGTTGVDASSGRILWYHSGWKCNIPITSPATMGEGRVFVTGGYNSGAAMIRVERNGNRWSVATEFKTREVNGQIHHPLLYEGHIYMNANDKKKADGLACLSLDGELRWKTGRSPGFDWGGLLLAEEKIYTVDGNTGDVVLIKPDPKGYREIARAKRLGGNRIWATIALSEGKLLVRDQRQMKCLDLSAR